MTYKKGQISLEFMIIFSFILVVFLFLFSLITQQRALTQNSQTFSQLQLVAQTIALQLTQASQAGNGFSASLPITTNIGTIPYNVSITKGGIVIVSAKLATQTIIATAYSNVQSVSSNPAYFGTANTFYVLPIGNGTIYFQNSYGTICVDYSCQGSINQSSSVSLSAQVVHVPNFNGQSSSVSIPSSSSINFERTNPFSISLWIKSSATGTSGILEKFNYGTTTGYYIRTDPSKLYFVIASSSGGNSLTALYNNEIRDGKWHNLVFTYDGSSSSAGMAIYIDGNSVPLTLSGTVTTSIQNSNPLSFGTFTYSGGSYLNGQLSNVQIYNVLLSQNQVKNLYQAGINTGPISQNIVGLWPLNGNANDYSGNGNNGAISGSMVFTTVAQISAYVANPLGKAVNSLLVGFTTTLGNFTNGNGAPSQGVSNYTNSNGIATTFLNQLGNNGQATIRATALNGNFLPAANVVAWYPLNLGQGNVAHDISGNKNNGAFNGQPSWSVPNYAASFDGQTGYLAASSPYTFQANSFTISMWVYPASATPKTPGTYQIFLATGPSCGVDAALAWGENIGGANPQPNDFMGFFADDITPSSFAFSLNNWYYVTAEWNSTTKSQNLYINGALAATRTSTGILNTGVNAITIGNGIGTCTGDGSYFKGSMSNIQIYNAALTPSQVGTLYREGMGGQPLTSNLANWYPLSGNTQDYSGNGRNATIYGGITFTPLTSSILPQQIATANASKVLVGSFNSMGTGNPSYVTIPSNKPDFNGLAQATITAWINLTNPITQGAIVENANEYYLVGRTIGSSTYLGAYFYGLSPAGYYLSGAPLQVNQLTQVGVTYNGSSVALYINGAVSNTIAVTGNIVPSGSTSLQIGGELSVDRFFPGTITNAQVYKNALNSRQMSQLYSEGLSGSPIPGQNVLAWWPLGGNTNDYSFFGNNGTATNVIYKSRINYVPYILQSLNYSGTNLNGQSYIATSNNLIYNFDWSNPFTISAFIKTSNSLEQTIVGKIAVPSVVNGYTLEVNTGGALRALFWDNAGGFESFSTTKTVNDGNWHHVVEVESGSGAVSLYIDGVSQPVTSSGAITGSIKSIGALYIGTRFGSSPFSNFNGSISNVQIYNAALSPSQVQQLYNSGIPSGAVTTVPLSWYP